jgi:hypothetical protein
LIINLLGLKGFGKFNKKEIGLHEGVNLVYGKNEAGKSTMQEFIKAMFFANRSLRGSDFITKYKPWEAEIFGGNLHYTLDNGERYRIERNFENGTVKIYDAGFNDISGSFDIRKERGPVFAKKHLGVDESFFEQTVFVRQMKSRLSGNARKELVESAVNMFQTGLEDVSISTVVEELQDILRKNIGNSRTKIKPLHEIRHALDRLQQEEKRLMVEREKVFNSVSYTPLEKQRESLDLRIHFIEWLKELLQKKKEIATLKENKSSIEAAYNSLLQKEGYAKELKNKDQQYLTELKEEYDFLKNNLDKKTEELEKMEIELEEERLFMKNVAIYQNKIEELLRNPEGTIGTLQSKIKKIDSIKNVFLKNADWTIGVISASSIYLGLSSFEISNAEILSLLVGIIVYMILQKLKMREKKTEKASLKDSEISLTEILNTLGVKDIGEYYHKVGQYDIKILKFERLNDEIVENELRIGRIEGIINKVMVGDEPKESAQDFIPKSQNMDTIVVYNKLRDLEDGIQSKENEFEESFQEILNQVISNGFLTNEDGDYKERQVTEANLLELIQWMTERAHEVERELLILEKDTEISLKDIHEIDTLLRDIAHKRLELERDEKRLQDMNFSVGTAISNIKEAGENIKRNTLPMLSQNFGEIAKKITNGKYDHIKVDENYQIKALEPYLENIIDVAVLSGGALEQIYLSLRLSIADSVTKGKEKLPIILDEVFAYYDDERTFESYRMLKEFYQNRQIVLFTCKSREIEIAQEVFGSSFNYIELPS